MTGLAEGVKCVLVMALPLTMVQTNTDNCLHLRRQGPGIREAQALASRQVIWTEMLAQVEEMLGHGKDVLQEWEQQQGPGRRIDRGKRELKCL